MKVNNKLISKLINALENTSELSTSNVRRLEDTGEGEYIIRFEDGNNITTSIYFVGEWNVIFKVFSPACRRSSTS